MGMLGSGGTAREQAAVSGLLRRPRATLPARHGRRPSPRSDQSRVLHHSRRSRRTARGAVHALPGLRRVLLPAAPGVCQVPVAAHRRGEGAGARHAVQLYVRPHAALRLDAGRAHGRLWRGPGRSAGRPPAPGAPRRQERGLPRRHAPRRRARRAPRGTRERGRHHPVPADGELTQMEKVAILGVGMIRFGLYPDTHHTIMGRDAGLAALDDAGISMKDIDAVYVGHLFMPAMAGVRAVKEIGITGAPVQRVANPPAPGAAAMREAHLAIAGGHYDTALVRGFDKMTTVIGSAPNPTDMDEAILPAAFFAMWATRRMHERGTKPEHLAAIAGKNWNYGALYPMWPRQDKGTVHGEKVMEARMVSWPLTAMMSCPIGDGAAAAVLCRADLAKKYQPDRPVVRIAASHLGSEVYERGHLFMGPVVGPAQMSRDAAKHLYQQAGFGPESIQLVQVHDAFVIEELEYYELLGFCREGEAEKCIEEGRFGPGGAVPFSTDGGLTARGHPGGPTGLAQIWETTLQLRGEAGKRQVPNARAGLCHMMGGGSVCAAHILVRE